MESLVGCINLTELNRTVNETEALSDESDTARVAKEVKYYVMNIAVTAVCALGLLGNLLSLIVLTTEKMSRTLTKMEISAHLGLIALSVSDFLFCLLVLITGQAPFRDYYEAGDATLHYQLVSNGLITIFIISSTWLIVVMAAERYIAVCHPLRARKLISLRRTRVCIILVFVLCAIATVPIFLEGKIQSIQCSDGRIVYKVVNKDNESVKLRRILWAVFFDFIPCAALVYFNLCLIIQIRRAKKLRDQMTPKHTMYRYQGNGRKTEPSGGSFINKNAGGSPKNGQHGKNGAVHFKDQQVNIGRNDNFLSPDRNRAPKTSSTKSNGQTKYLVSYKSDREPSSRSSQSESEFKNLNPNPVGPGGHSPSTKKVAVGSTSVRRRPSDSALNTVTATLVAVVLLFLILVSPSELLKFSLGYALEDENKVLIVRYVTNLMQVTNFSLNFVLYCAVNKSFRHTLRGLVCCCWLSLRG